MIQHRRFNILRAARSCHILHRYSVVSLLLSAPYYYNFVHQQTFLFLGHSKNDYPLDLLLYNHDKFLSQHKYNNFHLIFHQIHILLLKQKMIIRKVTPNGECHS